MRESSLVPTRLLQWPRCASLVPDLKLVLLSLWSSPHLSSAGAGVYPIREAAATLGFDPEALRGGIGVLAEAGLVAYDEQTGEIFVLDWYRFHRFRGGRGVSILESDIARVESARIRDEIEAARHAAASRAGAGSGSRIWAPAPAPAPTPAPTPAPAPDGFVLPPALDSRRAAIRRAAQQARLSDDQTQALADELVGRLRDTSAQPLKLPAAWLRRAASAIAAGEASKWGQAGAADRVARLQARRPQQPQQQPTATRRLSREERDAMLAREINAATKNH